MSLNALNVELKGFMMPIIPAGPGFHPWASDVQNQTSGPWATSTGLLYSQFEGVSTSRFHCKVTPWLVHVFQMLHQSVMTDRKPRPHGDSSGGTLIQLWSRVCRLVTLAECCPSVCRVSATSLDETDTDLCWVVSYMYKTGLGLTWSTCVIYHQAINSWFYSLYKCVELDLRYKQ